MVAFPKAIPVTTPVLLTVAIDALLVLHVTLLLLALLGATVVVNVAVEPIFILTEVGVTETPVTGTVVPPTVMIKVFVLLQPEVFVYVDI